MGISDQRAGPGSCNQPLNNKVENNFHPNVLTKPLLHTQLFFVLTSHCKQNGVHCGNNCMSNAEGGGGGRWEVTKPENDLEQLNSSHANASMKPFLHIQPLFALTSLVLHLRNTRLSPIVPV